MVIRAACHMHHSPFFFFFNLFKTCKLTISMFKHPLSRKKYLELGKTRCKIVLHVSHSKGHVHIVPSSMKMRFRLDLLGLRLGLGKLGFILARAQEPTCSASRDCSRSIVAQSAQVAPICLLFIQYG